MFKRTCRRICAADAPSSLTAWLWKLHTQVERLPPASAGTRLASPADLSASSSPVSPDTVWAELHRVAQHAHSLKETDSVLSLVNALCRKGLYPPSGAPSTEVGEIVGNAGEGVWAVLANRLLTYAQVEATSVLQYPGKPQEEVLAALYQEPSPGTSVLSGATMTVPCSRETLLMTGGVVPLSSRAPCDDGRSLGVFLEHFCNAVDAGAIDAAVLPVELAGVSAAVVSVMSRNSATLLLEATAASVARFMLLLYRVDMAADGQGTIAEGGDSSAGAEHRTEGFLLNFCARLSADVTPNAIGARLCAVGLACVIEQSKHAALAEEQSTGASVGMQQMLLSQHFFEESPRARAVQLQMLRMASESLYQHYERGAVDTGGSDARASGKPRHLRSTAAYPRLMMVPLFQSFRSYYEAVFQYNNAHGNPLELSDATQQAARAAVSLATLRALRVEAVAPDQFLRESMAVVDSCPGSMAIEGELLAGKVALFECFDLDEEGRAALYDDLISSLRHLVDLRPRTGDVFGADGSGSADGDGVEGGEGYADEYGRAVGGAAGDDGAVASPSSSADNTVGSSNGGTDMDPTSRRILQTAHEQVIRTLCGSLDTERINDAYGIVVAHKYHGLKVTKDVIQPLLEVMSRRGDCRVFNLVDVCVLYSHSTVDMRAITCLFRACAVAGDHYRARTLLQLLQDVVPGFLLKAPREVQELLRDLRVLPPQPFHLFMTEEERMVKVALAGGNTAAASSPLKELPSSTQNS